MSSSTTSGIDGHSRVLARDHQTIAEARLWERARRNLTLLYGGRRACLASQAGATDVTCTLGAGKIEV